jgi:hypothetical protein
MSDTGIMSVDDGVVEDMPPSAVIASAKYPNGARVDMSFHRPPKDPCSVACCPVEGIKRYDKVEQSTSPVVHVPV